MQGTKGTGDNGASNKLADLSTQAFNQSSPFLSQLFGAGSDIMKTGGTNSMIPFITQLVQGLKSTLSQTMQDTQARLGMTRSAGTPFGQRILAQTELQGQQGIAQAGPNAAMQFLNPIISAATNNQNTAVGGLGASANANANVLSSQNSAYSNILSSMIGAVGTAAGAAGGAMVGGPPGAVAGGAAGSQVQNFVRA